MNLFLKQTFCLLTLVMSLYAGDKLAIAVSELNGEGVEASTVNLISDRFCNELTNTGGFTVLERAEIKSILEEQEFQQSGACDDNSCIVEVGRFLGVSHIIAGSIGKIDNIFIINLRVIAVETGEILYTAHADCRKGITEVLDVAIKDLAQTIHQKVEKSLYATLSIKTEPVGATVFLDNREMGSTPYNQRLIKPGIYPVRISMKTYQDVTEKITFSGGDTVVREITLSHTEHYLDSIAEAKRLAELEVTLKHAAEQKKKEAEEKAQKRRKRIVRQIIFGSIGSSLAGAGVYFDQKVADKVQQKEALYNSYMAAATNFETYRTEYDRLDKKAEDYELYRNIFYGVAGGMGVTFSVSFFF